MSYLQIELEEIEAREEVYPETRAFLEFLLVLAENSPIPETLGAGYRTRGIGPYLQFVRDNVFLNFDTRSYRRPVEKVICLCMRHVCVMCAVNFVMALLWRLWNEGRLALNFEWTTRACVVLRNQSVK